MQARARHDQVLAARGVRKQQGAYYTPSDVVASVLALALDPLLAERAAAGPAAVAALRIVDPACGDGAFVVAAAERIADVLIDLGLGVAEASDRAVRCVWGLDVDPQALKLCRSALAAIAPAGGGRRFRRGDALLEAGLLRGASFDLVVGNPPFLSQLDRTTARSAADGDLLRARFGDGIAAYTDPAAVFALLGHRLARPDGGVVAMIEPISFLSSRDAAGIRSAVLAGAGLRALWLPEERVFDAHVEVCVPVVERGVATDETRLHRGRAWSGESLAVPAPGPTTANWSHLLADGLDLPRRTLRTEGRLADVALATADFRDQYYGLAGRVVDQEVADDQTHPRLVTAGLIDPAHLKWGAERTRFNKVAFQHPRVDLALLDPRLRAWATSRLVPKVLLAPQTRVLEAVVDDLGALVPSVPVVSVTPTGGGDGLALWRIAAVLTCPPVALEATRRHVGSGRNARSIRMRAIEVLDLPLPADREPWDAAARQLRALEPDPSASRRREVLTSVAESMGAAYGLAGDDELVAWWLNLLPGRRGVDQDG